MTTGDDDGSCPRRAGSSPTSTAAQDRAMTVVSCVIAALRGRLSYVVSCKVERLVLTN